MLFFALFLVLQSILKGTLIKLNLAKRCAAIEGDLRPVLSIFSSKQSTPIEEFIFEISSIQVIMEGVSFALFSSLFYVCIPSKEGVARKDILIPLLC
jgi:hypothetical protein